MPYTPLPQANIGTSTVQQAIDRIDLDNASHVGAEFLYTVATRRNTANHLGASVIEQAPAAGAKLTTGEVIHLFITGSSNDDATTVSTPARTRCRTVIIVQWVIILVLLAWKFFWR